MRSVDEHSATHSLKLPKCGPLKMLESARTVSHIMRYVKRSFPTTTFTVELLSSGQLNGGDVGDEDSEEVVVAPPAPEVPTGAEPVPEA